MKGRTVITVFLAAMLMLGVATVAAHAYGQADSKGCGMDFEKKFCQKAQFILSNQEEMGLSDEQVEKMKELKMNLCKEMIKKDAEISIAALDIETEMHKDPINIEALNKLIDSKYDLKKEKAKAAVSAYAALKGMLTKEQKDKMKELWKKCGKEKMECQMMAGKMKHVKEGGPR